MDRTIGPNPRDKCIRPHGDVAGTCFGSNLPATQFDLWYAHEYTLSSLLLQKLSIAVGSVTLFLLCWRIRTGALCRLSGAAFWVYLVHEFPLRAVVQRIADRLIDPSFSFWLNLPLVVIVCFVSAVLLTKWCPPVIELVTGGRTPARSPT